MSLESMQAFRVWLFVLPYIDEGLAALDAEQVHVSVTGESSVTISWASPSHQLALLMIEELRGSGGDSSSRRSPYSDGTPVEGTRRELTPNATRYKISCGPRYGKACASESIYHSPLLLHAFWPVKPATRYRYKIGFAEVWGAWRGFVSPPAAGARDLRIAVVGDVGQTQFSRTTCEALARNHVAENIDFAILVGDVAYADSEHGRWDSFGRLFDTGGCSQIPWLILPGDHEIEPDEVSGEPFIAYRQRWRTPQVAPEEVGNDARVIDWDRFVVSAKYDFGGSFYSVRLGSAHMIMLNPYTSSDESSHQVAWLRQEVQRVDRSVTPNLLVFTHNPFYHSNLKHQTAIEVATYRLKAAVLPILLGAQVDMVLSAHVHAYERTHPIDGITYVVVGHAGNRESFHNEWAAWSHSAARFGDSYGWGALTLSCNESTWSARRSSDGAIMDFLKLDWSSRATCAQQARDQAESDGGNTLASATTRVLVGFLACVLALLATCGLVVVCWKLAPRVSRPWNAKPEERADLTVSPLELGARA